MSALEEQNLNGVDEEWKFPQIPIAECLSAIWNQRRWLGILTAIGTLVTIGIAFLIPSEYTSTAQLMPLDPQTFSSTSALNPLTGAAAGLLGSSVAGGLLHIAKNEAAENEKAIHSEVASAECHGEWDIASGNF
jgi:hypothetical protein